MNTLSHNLPANDQYHLPYDYGAIPWLQQKQRLLSQGGGSARPSFCPVAGLDNTFLNPYPGVLTADCICSGNDNGTLSNSTTAAAQQIIAYVDGSYIDLNCTNNNNGGGNVTWELLSCLDADTFYRHEAEAGDLEMLASWWSPDCCLPEDDIHKFWWSKLQEHREGIFGRTGIVTSGVTGMISIISSSTFIWMLRRSHDGLSTSQNRVLLGLCVSDIIFSLPFVSFGMFVPKELDYFSWNARGNMATCQITGCMIVVGGTLGPWYNASLCVLLLAIVKYEKSDEHIRKKIEPYLHAVPCLTALIIAIVQLVSGIINPDGYGNCSPEIYNPPHCSGVEDGSVILEGLFSDIPCGRGNAPNILVALILTIIPPIIMITCLAMIYRIVLITEQKMSKYGARSILKNETSPTFSLRMLGLLKKCLLLPCASCKKGNPFSGSKTQQRRTKKRSNSRLVMYKGVAYSCSWLLSWGLWAIITSVVRATDKGEALPAILFPLISLMHATLPLQGLFNLTIYMHPKILAARRSKRENLSWWKSFVKAFWSKGVGGKKTKGEQSGPRRIGDKTRRHESSSNTMRRSNGLRGTVETRSLRSKKQRFTKGSGEEEKQEIEAPWNAPCVSFGHHPEFTTNDNPVSPIPVHNLVLDAVVEDSKHEIGCVNENNPDAIAEASIMESKGKAEILEVIDPIHGRRK